MESIPGIDKEVWTFFPVFWAWKVWKVTVMPFLSSRSVN